MLQSPAKTIEMYAYIKMFKFSMRASILQRLKVHNAQFARPIHGKSMGEEFISCWWLIKSDLASI